MNKTLIEITDLPGRFAEALQRLVRGEEVVITENQVPRAKLIITPSASPPPDGKPRVLGLDPGQQVWMSDDFDAPLPDEFWQGKS
jgi:antitoxin (DNA-binding transcriptional repressor) of toxin-antitoxin stability system